jgi:hypothetical protein
LHTAAKFPFTSKPAFPRLHFGQRHSRIVTRHSEEQSDEAIQQSLSTAWIASLRWQ